VLDEAPSGTREIIVVFLGTLMAILHSTTVEDR